MKLRPTMPRIENAYLVSAEIRGRLIERLDELIEIVRWRAFPGFAPPRLQLYDHKQAAGTANARKRLIRINAIFLTEHTDSMLHETVAHELAHLVVGDKWPDAKPHGREWKCVMRRWFDVEPGRLHSYNTARVKSRLKRFAYRCSCKQWILTSIRHKRSERAIRLTGGPQYYCHACASPLIYQKGALPK